MLLFDPTTFGLHDPWPAVIRVARRSSRRTSKSAMAQILAQRSSRMVSVVRPFLPVTERSVPRAPA